VDDALSACIQQGGIMNLPQKVEIIEVGPRDGFQNIGTFIETKHKLEIIDALEEAGLKKIQVTSFVNPKWIPQMKDAKEVCETCVNKEERKYKVYVLCPNKRGVELAVASESDVITIVISVSEAHNKANINSTVEDSFLELEEIVKAFPDIKFRLDLATVFGCPFGKEIRIDRIIELIKRARQIGVSEIMLADTVGMGNPLLIEEVLTKVEEEIGREKIILHIHDTRGMGLANMLTAMQLGFDTFETSIGGLGGCPFAPGAAGNVATEDFVNMLDSLKIEHNIDIEKLYKAVELVDKYVDAEIKNSHMYSVYKAQKEK